MNVHRPAAERRDADAFFARISTDPLADAFSGRMGAHAHGGGMAVPPEEVAGLWHGLKAAPRTGPSVAYVHVPFCENRCLFCGFYQNPWRRELGAPYVDAVLAQLEAGARTAAQQGHPLRAVYLGGGTPTALAARDIARLVEGLHRHLPLAPDCEITLEGRIVSFGLEKARAAFDAGVNRISLGVQTFDDGVRRRMGRKSTRAETVRFLEGLMRLDRGAVVIDLIYGLPGQDRATFQEDVRLAAALGLDGLDLYSLKSIPGTPLMMAQDKGKLAVAAPGELGHFYADGAAEMDRAGWEAISTTHWRQGTRERSLYNFEVKAGAHCLAFGAGAGGNLQGHGFRIVPDLDTYRERAANGGAGLVAGLIRPSPLGPAHAAIKAGMERGRLVFAPVDRALASCGVGGGFEPLAAPLLAQWQRAGLLTGHSMSVALTLAGRFWQVAMTARLIAWTDLRLSEAENEAHRRVTA
ncbi:putative heme utilization radical SAM enzyme HutW [Rhodovulum sulfidophilum]|uniref:Heme anaerobic degradation radical SAM methyltransferase ChuW/HutW n=1 Tax=Rhodovulum visakhapatnamense TaxID=364297 RepID=A0ABS1RB17_9RHOB|nr:heme anaerobic degradation radical SAM methyltransferase ChuW/HutW [Rhodovulum visakhapatnamense]MBL3570384.1 heme anaerobic degradation radical SAM methyltransferase ChuW/HutW [Rhodovulum visakhapatnamense]MBL3576836.1 heme anaerobic degradation radical SAM methyltransferase ChuW/HutW [Rhodovulum visakhapatnamense]OLS43938.1 putative heme utilization radical SAM enzyme HutW [Rhodovulum sulfidophilum]